MKKPLCVGVAVLLLSVPAAKLLWSQVKHPLVGKKAPDFTVTSLEGKKVKLSALKGKVVLVHFWATL